MLDTTPCAFTFPHQPTVPRHLLWEHPVTISFVEQFLGRHVLAECNVEYTFRRKEANKEPAHFPQHDLVPLPAFRDVVVDCGPDTDKEGAEASRHDVKSAAVVRVALPGDSGGV